MKKIIVLCTGICLFSLPLSATTSFYQADNGEIVAQITDNAGEKFCLSVTTDDDDDNNTTPSTPTDNPTPQEEQGGEEGQGEGAQSYVSQASQLLVDLLLGNKDIQIHERSQLSQLAAAGEVDENDFEDLQETLLAFVRDVNWKTHLKITYCDLTWPTRISLACKGAVNITKPLRTSLEAWTGDLSQQMEQGIDKATEGITTSMRGHAIDKVTRLSIMGLVDAVDSKNPFLLLLVDRQTFDDMVAMEPKVAVLYHNLYTFFKTRAIRMNGEKYDANTKELIRVSELGKGNYFETWNLMADFAQKMETLDGKGALSPEDEKNIHIVRLEASVRYVKEQTNVEKRAAQIAFKDPQNAGIVRELQQGPKKNPSLDDKARELLQKMTKEQIKALLNKYKMK